jgi:predicted PurR-regulated permease PerM
MTTASSSRFLIVTLLATFVALCILFAPYLAVFVLASVFGISFQPFNRKLRTIFGTNGAALISVIAVALLVVIILTVVVAQVVAEAGSILTALQSGTFAPDSAIAVVQAKMTALFPSAGIDVLASFQEALSWLLRQTGSVFQSIAGGVVTLFLTLFALYYWFKDSEKFRMETLRIIPLSREDAAGILDRLTLSVHSLIRGTLVVALIQGVVAGVGFVIFGVPNAFLWASITVFAALIPTLGTTIIILPMVAYLALSGHMLSAAGLAVWGMSAVGLIDNILGPKLMSRGTNMHPFFTLLSVLGGVRLFGPIGVFAGPLLVSLFFAVCYTYSSRQD